MKNVFLFVLLAVVSATITKCGFDPKDFPVKVVPLQKNKAVKESGVYESIRFHKHIFDMPTIQKTVERSTIETIATDVLNKIQSFLKVERTDSIIKVPANALTKDEGLVPEEHTNPGVADTDYVIYFTEWNCGDGSSTIATAGPKAAYDNNRPFIGVVHLCMQKAESMKTDKEYYEVVVLHEMMHAMGFGTLFDRFPDMVKDTTVNGKPFKQIVTPKVLATVKEHYGCDSMTGALLENDGGDGTANSHWERTLYNGELMQGWISSTEPNVLTNMTLSWLEDTGFYQVDYSVAEELKFGKNRGCEMTNMKCKDEAGKAIGDFCDTNVEQQCNYNYKGQGYCIDSKAVDGLNCPVATMYTNGLCTNPENNKSPENDYGFGRFYGVNGFCQNNEDFLLSTVTSKDKITNVCTKIQCPPSTPNEYQIVLCPLKDGCKKDSDYKIGTCKNEGEKITVDGYKGTITCVKRDYVCSASNGYDSSVPIIDGGKDDPIPSSTTSPTTTTKTDGGDDGDDDSHTSKDDDSHTNKDGDNNNVSNMYVICSMLLFIALTLF